MSEATTLSTKQQQELDAFLASPEQSDRIQGPDRILGMFGDLNAPLRALAPIEVPADPGFAREGALNANFNRNLASLPFEAAKAINSPLKTLDHLGSALMGLIKKSTGPAISRAAGITPDDADIQAAEAMGRGLAHQFTDEGREQRPLDPVLTVGSLAIPALRARGVLPAANAGTQAARLINLAEDPGMFALGEFFKGGRKVAGRAREALPDRPRPIKNLTDRIPEGTGQESARTLTDAALGFSAATGPQIQRIIRTAPERGTSRIIKAYSGPVLDPVTNKGAVGRQAKVNLLEAVHRGADRVKEQIDDFQNQASEALAPHMRTGVEEEAMELLKKEALSNLKEHFNAKVNNEWHVEVQQHGQVGQGSVTIRERSGEAAVELPRFPHKAPTQISAEGRGASMVQEFHERLVNAPPTTVGALQRFMWEIDDAIKISDNEIGKQANRALVQLRNRVRETLSDQFGGKDNPLNIYDDATRQYESDMEYLSNTKIELGVEPGRLTSEGRLKGGMDREAVVHQLVSSMDEAEELAYGTLLELEKRGGVPHLQDRVAGVATQGLLGQGLVAKSELSQGFRGVATRLKQLPAVFGGGGTVAALGAYVLGWPLGTVLGLGSSVMFSPKLMQRVMLDMAPGARPQFHRWSGQVKNLMESASAAGVPVSKWIQEGLTIEQVLNRLEAADERSDTPRNPPIKRNATLQALGGITPPF